MVQALHPLIQDTANPATRDNAAGAVGRMLSSMPLQLPLDQVLPVLLSMFTYPACFPHVALPNSAQFRHTSDPFQPISAHLSCTPLLWTFRSCCWGLAAAEVPWHWLLAKHAQHAPECMLCLTEAGLGNVRASLVAQRVCWGPGALPVGAVHHEHTA